jgi:hypothetical protein
MPFSSLSSCSCEFGDFPLQSWCSVSASFPTRSCAFLVACPAAVAALAQSRVRAPTDRPTRLPRTCRAPRKTSTHVRQIDLRSDLRDPLILLTLSFGSHPPRRTLAAAAAIRRRASAKKRRAIACKPYKASSPPTSAASLPYTAGYEDFSHKQEVDDLQSLSALYSKEVDELRRCAQKLLDLVHQWYSTNS